jgi:hypothetical protein
VLVAERHQREPRDVQGLLGHRSGERYDPAVDPAAR